MPAITESKWRENTQLCSLQPLGFLDSQRSWDLARGTGDQAESGGGEEILEGVFEDWNMSSVLLQITVCLSLVEWCC